MAKIPVMQGIEIKDDKGKVVYTLYCKDAEGRADLAEYKKEVAAQNADFEAMDDTLKREIGVERARIDLLSKLPTGSTSGDAALQDLRVSYTGETYDTPGEAVRGADTELQEQITDLQTYNDVKDRLSWTTSKAINAAGDLYDATNENYGVAKIKLPKGATVSGNLTSVVTALALGTEARPLSPVVAGDGETAFNYTVTAPYEWLWFCCDTRQLDASLINVELPAVYEDDNGFMLPNFTKGYITAAGGIVEDTVYAYSDLIRVGAMQQLTFTTLAPSSIVTLVEYTSGGVFKRVLQRGQGTDAPTVQTFTTGETTYVRIVTRVRGDMDINDVNIYLNDYTTAVRKPTFDYRDGYISSSDNASRPGDGTNPYLYTGLIELMAGETIRFYTAGSTGIWALSEWTYDNTFVRGIYQGDDYYHIYDYTAPNHMFVRLCGKIVTSGDPVVSRENFLNPLIYYKSLYYANIADSILYKKKCSILGDSLAYGNRLGPGASWFHLAALKYDWADENNLGINGNTVAKQTTETTNAPMCERYTYIPESDYIVVQGGANDKRLSVPLGTIDSTDVTTFAGALNVIIDGIREMYPKAKLLFMTNYNRYPDRNSLGLNDADYALTMLEVCANKAVPCFDNYTGSGIYFLDEHMAAWQDEGMELRGVENRHLSVEAYEWIANKYERLMLDL